MKSSYRPIFAAGITILVTSCGNGAGPGEIQRIEQLPRELSVAEAGLIEADNRFAFKLFQEITGAEAEGTRGANCRCCLRRHAKSGIPSLSPTTSG